MEKQILIIKNITREGPGIIENVIREYGIKYTILDLSKSTAPGSLKKYGAVVILGGPDSANDENQKMEYELDLIRDVIKSNIPYLGICLGLQTLVKATGGQVVKSQFKEVGFRDQNGAYYRVELTEEGERDQLFAGLDNSFDVFHLHGETVLLTENMKLLATGKFCRNQIVKIGLTSYGIQCHFELTREMLEFWINDDPDLQKLDKKELRSDFLKLKEKYIQTGNQLFRNFLNIAGFL
jgi:GMP synthase (glutamine-hydrolysing)